MKSMFFMWDTIRNEPLDFDRGRRHWADQNEEETEFADNFLRRYLNIPEDDGNPGSEWPTLPDVVIEDIFSRLSMKSRFRASMVCKAWNRAFYLPGVWRTLIVRDKTFTRKKFTVFRGYQDDLSHWAAQLCLGRVGYHFHTVVITPIACYFNLYQFMVVLRSYLEFFGDESMPNLHTFEFTFACESRSVNGREVHGTGGNILDEFKRLLANLRPIRNLRLGNLLLTSEDAADLLASAAEQCFTGLRTLQLINITKKAFPLHQVLLFVNLHTLSLSAQHISESLLESFCENKSRIQWLHIVQDEFTEEPMVLPFRCWKEFRRNLPTLKIRLVCAGKTREELLWQPGAPVHEIVYSSPYVKITPQMMVTISDLYSETLQSFVFCGLPKVHSSRHFDDRCDSVLLLLLRNCTRVSKLQIRDKVSTGTLLLIADEFSRRLDTLIVRRNAILKRCDWPKNPSWSKGYFSWLKASARCYDDTEKQIGILLQRKWWRYYTDKQFKRIHV